jgi:hypothetical protein
VADVYLMSFDDRVLHKPGPVHAMALCGEPLRDPWASGPMEALADKALLLCEDCWDRV